MLNITTPHHIDTQLPKLTVDLGHRVAAARNYLATPQEWMLTSRLSHQEADRSALKTIKQRTVTNLISYFGLDPETALGLLWEYPTPNPEILDQCWMDRLESRFGENTYILDEEFDAMAETARHEIPSLATPQEEEAARRLEFEIMTEILSVLQPEARNVLLISEEFRTVYKDVFRFGGTDACSEELRAKLCDATDKGEDVFSMTYHYADVIGRSTTYKPDSFAEAMDFWENYPYGIPTWKTKS